MGMKSENYKLQEQISNDALDYFPIRQFLLLPSRKSNLQWQTTKSRRKYQRRHTHLHQEIMV